MPSRLGEVPPGARWSDLPGGNGHGKTPCEHMDSLSPARRSPPGLLGRPGPGHAGQALHAHRVQLDLRWSHRHDAWGLNQYPRSKSRNKMSHP